MENTNNYFVDRRSLKRENLVRENFLLTKYSLLIILVILSIFNMEGYQLGRDFEALNTRVTKLETRLESLLPEDTNDFVSSENLLEEFSENTAGEEVEIEQYGFAAKAKRYSYRNRNGAIEFKNNPTCVIYKDGLTIFRATIKNNLGSAWRFKGKVILQIKGSQGIIGTYRKTLSLDPNEQDDFKMRIQPAEVGRDWPLITSASYRPKGKKYFDPFA